MEFSSNKRFIAILILIIIIWVGAIMMVELEYENRYESYIDYRDDVFENAVAGALGSYESFSNFIFTSAIDNDRVKSIIADANGSDEFTKNRMRKRLAEELAQTHELIKKYNFRQFHFQLSNGDSFYRFHSPEKFGDNLLEVRESMRFVNREHKYIAGFEEGRIFNGYRFVYPLIYQEEYVGSIEISISTKCILEELISLDKRRDLGFILRKDIMESTVFEDQQSRYIQSLVSEDYVSDIEVFEMMDNNGYGLKLYRDPDFLERLRHTVSDKLGNNESFSVSMYFEGKIYLIQYQEIKDLSNRSVGYLFCYKEDEQIQAMMDARKITQLLASIAMGVLVLLMIFAYKKQRQIQKLAMTDQLTKIYNRHSFYDFAEKEIARSDRNGEAVSLGMIDLDLFKKVNDKFGHTTGDEVLRTVAKITSEAIRISDVFARFGGEEFVILMPSTGIDEATIVAERIRERIENFDFPKAGKITVSVGITERKPRERIDDTIDRADEALYKAKKAGRNRVVAI